MTRRLVQSVEMQRFGGVTRNITIAVVALLPVACVEEGPADPTPPPAIVGAYTLTLEASAVCRLPVSRFAWDVEATSSGEATATGETVQLRTTLPGGDAAVDLNGIASIDATLNGTLTVRSAAFSEEEPPLRVSVSGATRGSITAGAGGRGQVVDGTYNGTIGLAPPDDPDPRATGSCTAADHRFTLAPR
jgi:hypothetical protein